jgi:hypothetical protein
MNKHDASIDPVSAAIPDAGGPALASETAAIPRAEWLQKEHQLRQEALQYRQQEAVLRQVRELLDPLWALHPDWTFEQVCAQFLAEHPEGVREDAP